MPVLHVKLVTAERKVVDEDADMVIAPGGAGELGILPRHIPLITTLKPGELRVRQGSEEHSFAVIVLADAAERAEELDLECAREAMRRAEQLLSDRTATVDAAAAQAALMRALVRVRVAERRQHNVPRQDRT